MVIVTITVCAFKICLDINKSCIMIMSATVNGKLDEVSHFNIYMYIINQNQIHSYLKTPFTSLVLHTLLCGRLHSDPVSSRLSGPDSTHYTILNHSTLLYQVMSFLAFDLISCLVISR